jgi:hypothetical protein
MATDPTLDIAAEVTFGATLEVAVTVSNRGDTALRAVAPEVRYRLVEHTGAPAVMRVGDRHTWHTGFPLPSGPGGDVLVVLVRWEDANGGHSLPYARVVETPGLPSTEAQVLVASQPATGYEQATVQIVNATGKPLRARLVAVIPEEYFTTPVAQPVDVAPRQTIAVPIKIQSGGAVGTTYPFYASLQFTQGGMSRAIVAGTTLGVGTTPDRSAVPPLAVGTTLLLLAIAVTLFANQRAARRRALRDAGP